MNINKDYIQLKNTLECEFFAPSKADHINIKCTTEVPSKSDTIDTYINLAPVVTSIIAFVMMYITARKYSKDYQLQQDSVKRDKENLFRESELNKIEKFYGPMKALREESFVLYQYFAIEEKTLLKEKGKTFRTLRHLTQSNSNSSDEIGIKKFSSHDQSILRSILDVSDKNLKLIEDHGGYIDNPELHELLGRLTAHFRTLKLAANGELEGMSEKLESIVFPREIDGAIDNEIRKIQESIKNYDTKKKYHPKSKSIKYYDKNFQDYSLNVNNTLKLTPFGFKTPV
ncbi:MAG: hypothetical protein P1P93_07500 [Gammaproteobacteria bacterium]|nr:hypothetical protein [Gammaproteobacteria bacterium]